MMPAPLTPPVLQEDWYSLVSSSKGCHRMSRTPLLRDWLLFCPCSACWCGSPVSPCATGGVQRRAFLAPPMAVQSRGVQASGDHPTASGGDGGQTF